MSQVSHTIDTPSLQDSKQLSVVEDSAVRQQYSTAFAICAFGKRDSLEPRVT